MFNNIKILLAIAIIALAVVLPAKTQQWKLIYQTPGITSANLVITNQGTAAGGSYFIRTSYTGTSKTDSVIWKLDSLDVLFRDTIWVYVRGLPNSTTTGRFSLRAFHQDTMIRTGWGGLYGDSVWYRPRADMWEGTLSRVDAIALVLFFDTDFEPGTVVADFDEFAVRVNGKDSVFYDGGEMGKVEGTVFFDQNQSGSQDQSELGLNDWKVYLVPSSSFLATSSTTQDQNVMLNKNNVMLNHKTVMLNSFQHLDRSRNNTEMNSAQRFGMTQGLFGAATIDSAITDINGYYIFPRVTRGTYAVTLGIKPGWTNTSPAESVITVGDTLNWSGINFGVYSSEAKYYRAQKGWNMISLPKAVYDSAKTSLFPTAISYAFAYNGSNYEIANTLERGKGYWIKFPSEQEVPINGFDLQFNTVTLAEGWNMIGAIAEPIACGDLTVDPPEVTFSPFFGYEGSYQPVDSLRPAKGYWVKASQAGSLYLNPPGGLAKAGSRINIVNHGELPPPPPEELATGSSPLVPSEFALLQNYPNPFNPVTVIRYQLKENIRVTLKVYSILGEEIKMLVDEFQDAGYKKVTWDANGVSSGIYLLRLVAGNFVEVKKLVLMK